MATDRIKDIDSLLREARSLGPSEPRSWERLVDACCCLATEASVVRSQMGQLQRDVHGDRGGSQSTPDPLTIEEAERIVRWSTGDDHAGVGLGYKGKSVIAWASWYKGCNYAQVERSDQDQALYCLISHVKSAYGKQE